MTQTLKTISQFQLDELREFTNDNIIEAFFERLNNNFGDGEVLSFEQIKSFFKQYMFEESSKDRMSLYIDTVRMLRLYNRDPNEIIDLNKYAVEILHDKLISDNQTDGTIDKIRAEKFEKSVNYFSNLSGQYDDIRVENISTLEELNEEGSSMNHCIASYHDIFIQEQYIGFRIFNTKTNERLTLGCRRKPGTTELTFNQLKGHGNSPATKESCLTVITFCQKNNILFIESELMDLMPAIADLMNFQ